MGGAKPMTNVSFVFICATVVTIFAGGAVLMSLISTGAQGISQSISNQAASFANNFMIMVVVLVIIGILAAAMKRR